MTKLNNICETYLPWTINNFLKWVTQIIFLPVLFLLVLWDTLKQPFTRDFHRGSVQLSWGWEILAGEPFQDDE